MAVILGLIVTLEVMVAGGMIFNIDFHSADMVAVVMGFMVLYAGIVAILTDNYICDLSVLFNAEMRICSNRLFNAGMSKQSLYCIHIRSLRQIKRCCTVSQVMHSDYICHTDFLHLPVHLGFNSSYNYREYSGILRIFIQTIHISL